ncbi:MAG: ABC1 family-domain-containing protein [Monoraphidium minutum]|nr:MAG: ABC1 family-domain-containing protein [Monoraphidium minutum]
MRRYAPRLVSQLARIELHAAAQQQVQQWSRRLHHAPGPAAAVASAAAKAAAARLPAAAGAAWGPHGGGCARAARGFSAAAPLARGAARLRYLLGFGGLVVAAQFEDVTTNARLAALAAVRLGRDVAAAAAVAADYKTSLAAAPPSGPARQAALSACHQRGADRLLALCFKNGGIYTKLGQHLAQLDHLVPAEYVDTMRANLLDRCPVSDYAEVAAIITQDLGSPPDQLFASFEREPIASASLAQVHVAYGHDGSKLAIKVQHAGLRESCAADIRTIELLVKGARLIFPDFNYQWLVDEIKENLPRELDFRHEAANAERCRANLASPKSRLAGRVAVPRLHPRLSSGRVLTMEFIDGARLTDPAALDALGVDRAGLAALVAEAFNEMIFIHGDVHCDPHAANMLVRKVGGRQQLVLLDHGLYRVIDDEFRARYAALWRALVFADADGIREHAAAMNAGDLYPLFAAMLTQRPWEQHAAAMNAGDLYPLFAAMLTQRPWEQHAAAMNAGDLYPLFAAMLTQRPWEQIVDRRIDHLALPKTREDRDLLQGYAQVYLREIGDLLLRMPRPLLLLLKTNDCLRSVDNTLGSPLNTIVMTARECTRALSDIRSERAPGLRSWLARTRDAAHVEFVVLAMRGLALWAAVRSALWGRRRGGARSGGGGAGAGGDGGGGGLPPLEQLPAEFVAATAGGGGGGGAAR